MKCNKIRSKEIEQLTQF